MRSSIVLIVLIILTGCGTTPPIVTTVVQPDAPVAVPTVDPLTLNPVQWQVLTVQQVKQLLAQMEASPKQPPILFSLDTKNYENLSLNLIEIERYISQQKAILTMLETIITDRSVSKATTSK